MRHSTGTFKNLFGFLFKSIYDAELPSFGGRSFGAILVIAGVLLTFLACFDARAAGAEFILNADTKHLTVDSIEYLSETQPLNYLQASDERHASQWKILNGKSFNFGNFHAPVWLRFDLVNVSDTKRSCFLRIRHELLERIDIVFYDKTSGKWSGLMKSGSFLLPEEQTFKGHPFLIPLSLAAGERSAVYLRVDSAQILQVRLDVWQHEVFWPHNQQDMILLGVFFGIMFVMILYNLSLYIFTRDSNYILYVVYVAATVLYELAATGIGNEYLWEHSLWLRENAHLFFALLAFLTGTLFFRYFLSVKKYGGWVLQFNNVFLAYWAIALILSSFLLNKVFFVLFQMMSVGGMIVSIAACIYLWVKGNVQAKYYLVAYLFLNLGTVILMLGVANVIEFGFFTEYSQMIGIILQLVLLSVALADRINRDRAASEEARRLSMELSEKMNRSQEEKLAIQTQMLEMQRQATENLELRVQERTNELERTMKNLELANHELSRLSFTDPLTQVYNRRYFEEILAGEIGRASRIRQPLSLVLIDIDHFKMINDDHGHLIGDECLRLVAKALSQQLLRTGDFIARFGGEEFAIVLPSTAEENARVVAERARAAVEGIYFVNRGIQVYLRVSIGVASRIPEPEDNSEPLITAADKALYQAKNSGRNRVVVADV